MFDGKSVVFPSVGFPKDFKEQLMKGKRIYDFNFLTTRGFAIIYTIIGNEDGFKEFIENLKKNIEKNSVKTYLFDDMDKPPKDYFNDILFNWYDIIRGIGVLGDFPRDILFFVTHMSELFKKDDFRPKIYLDTYEKITDKSNVYFIMLSNREDFVRGQLANTILDGHVDNLRKRIKEDEKLTEKPIKNVSGIVISGNNISIKDSQIINQSYFAPIYNEIEKRNPKNKEEIVKAVREIEEKGKIEKSWNFLKNNAP